MANSINLLPQNHQAESTIVSAGKKVSKAAVILGVIFFLGAAILVGLNYYFEQQLTAALDEVTSLEAEVRRLEPTEQKLWLTKDRLTKIQTLLAERSVYEELDKYDQIVTSLPSEASLTSMELDIDTHKLGVSTFSSLALKNVVQSVSNPSLFTNVSVTELGFNAALGYQLLIELF